MSCLCFPPARSPDSFSIRSWPGILVAAALLLALVSPSDVSAQRSTSGPDPEPVREAVHVLGKRGLVRDWLVLGPFPSPLLDDPLPGSSDQFGFDTDFLGDLGGERMAALAFGTAVSYSDQDGLAKRYVAFKVTTANNGVVDLNKIFDHVNHMVAYAFCYIRADQLQTATFRFGSDDGAKVWINGKLVHSIDIDRGLTLGEDRFSAQLIAGDNSVLVKVTDLVRDWGFGLEALNAEGAAEFEVEE